MKNFREGTYEIISNRASLMGIKMTGKKGRVDAWRPGYSKVNVMFYPFDGKPYRICIGKEEVKRVD